MVTLNTTPSQLPSGIWVAMEASDLGLKPGFCFFGARQAWPETQNNITIIRTQIPRGRAENQMSDAGRGERG
jgi:hypothetical protein